MLYFKKITVLVLILFLFDIALGYSEQINNNEVIVRPKEYTLPLRNPLKGFAMGIKEKGKILNHEWASVYGLMIGWNEIEGNESDSIDKIRGFLNTFCEGIEKKNIKVVPQIYLDWPGTPDAGNHRDLRGKKWPTDMKAGDYESDEFKRRLVRLIKRLGEAWDNDPRVAFVRMGFIGKWGEHHSPSISNEIQKILGDAFENSFKNKLVTVRNPWDFLDYNFGINWDSWAHIDENYQAIGIAKRNDLWKTAPIIGEVAYDWGNYKIQPGENPTDTLTDLNHGIYLLNTVRALHCTGLSWISDYDMQNPKARENAGVLQKALGYRFVIDEARYPSEVYANKIFNVAFEVRNTGSAPFYYNWPVEVSLLDKRSKEVVWNDTFKKLDIRLWLPGDFLGNQSEYKIKPKQNYVEGAFLLPKNIPDGEYILALAILDPAGMLPSVRFAIVNYYNGGRHPIGLIGVNKKLTNIILGVKSFDDPAKDQSLHYIAEETKNK